MAKTRLHVTYNKEEILKVFVNQMHPHLGPDLMLDNPKIVHCTDGGAEHEATVTISWDISD